MKVEREEFIAKLAPLKAAWATGGVVAELSHIWFDKKYVYAYDGGFGMRLEVPSELECGVPGGTLLALLETSSLKDAELDPAANSLQVKLGKSISKLSALPLERKVWPFPAKPPKAQPIELTEEFIEALRKTLFVKKGNPLTRVEHHGVMLCRNKEDLELYATDSATMVRVVLPKLGNGASLDKVLLPRDFAEELVSLCPEGADFYALDDCLLAFGNGVALYSNVLDLSNADDMGAIIDGQLAKHPKAIELPVGLESALARAEVLAGREVASVELITDSSGLKVSAKYGLGALNETLSLEGKLPSAKLRVEAGMLRRGLTHAEKFSLTKDSLVLTGGSDFVYVVAAS